METNPGSLQSLKYQTIKPEGDAGIGFQRRAFLTGRELLHDYQDEKTERRRLKIILVTLILPPHHDI